MCSRLTARTILLVDVESAVLKLMKALLDGAGFSVLTATGAREAFEICRQTKIDLLLTEISLPDLTGPQLAMHIANVDPGVRVLYMSRWGLETLRTMGFLWTEHRLLRRPFSPADLLNAVDGILDGIASAPVSRADAPLSLLSTDPPQEVDPPSIGSKQPMVRSHCPKSVTVAGN